MERKSQEKRNEEKRKEGMKEENKNKENMETIAVKGGFGNFWEGVQTYTIYLSILPSGYKLKMNFYRLLPPLYMHRKAKF